MLSRRALVGKLAAGAAVGVAWAAGGVRPSAGWARRDALKSSGAEPASGAMGAARAAADVGVQPAAELAPAPVAAVASTPASAAAGSAPAPWELLRPLRAGTAVGHGWRVAELSAVVDGACVLTLRNARGRTYRVHLCAHERRPQGIVYTDRFDLVVMNGGQGDLPTDEGLAQAVAAVAHVLAANEKRREHAAVVAGLLPHAERVRRYAAADGGPLR